MSDTITITLSRADAAIIQNAITVAEFECAIDEQDSHRLYRVLESALDAALAPEPGDALAAALPAIIRALRAENPESWTLVEMVEAGAFPLTDAERAAVLALAAPAEGPSFLQKMQKTQAAPTEGPGITRKRLAGIAEAIWNGTRWHTGEEGDFIEDATEILCSHFGIAAGLERAATGETLPGVDIIAHPAIPEGTIIAVTDELIERVAETLCIGCLVDDFWRGIARDAIAALRAAGERGE